MFCPHCGQENPDGSRFCSKCGQEMTVSVPSETENKPVSEPETVPVEETAATPVSTPKTAPENEAVSTPVSKPVPEKAAAETPVSTPAAAPVTAPVNNQVYTPNRGPVYGQYNGPAVPQNPVRQVPVMSYTPVQKGIMNVLGSPAFLIMTILITLSLVLSLVSSVFTSSYMAELVAAISRSSGSSSIAIGAAPSAIGAIITSLFGQIPLILIIIGLWLVYGSSRSGTIKTGGLSLIRGVMIFNIIMTCLGLAAVLFLSIVLFVMAGFSGNIVQSIVESVNGNSAALDTATISVISIVLVIVLSVVCFVSVVLALIYYIKQSGIIKGISTSLTTGRNFLKGSVYVRVMHIFFALSSVSGIVSLLTMSMSYTIYYPVFNEILRDSGVNYVLPANLFTGPVMLIALISATVSLVIYILSFVVLTNLSKKVPKQ